MYAVSAGFKTAVKQGTRTVGVKLEITNGATTNTYYEANVISLDYEDASNPSESFELGSVVAAQINLSLLDVTEAFETATYKPYIGIEVSGAQEYVPLGVFYADSVKKKKNITNLVLVDKMVKLEKAYNSALTFPASFTAVMNEIATKAGITWSGTLPAYNVPEKPAGATYREIVGRMGRLSGNFVKFDRSGVLQFESYTSASDTYTSDNYIDFEKTASRAYKIDKVSVVVSETSTLSSGTLSTGAELIFDDTWATQTMVNAIKTKYSTFTFTPATVALQGNPAIEVGDIITVTTIDDGNVDIPVMKHKISYSGGLKSEIESVGESDTQNQFSTTGSLTSIVSRVVYEQAIINNAIIDKATIEDLEATNARITNLVVTSAMIENATIQTADIGTAQIDTATIKDLAVTAAKIGNAAIGTANITNAAITSALIEDLGVVTADIGDATITTAKIGNLSVTTATIADAQITSAKIVDATITSADIANATITNADIANATIGTAQITDATISNADIANASIATANIQDLAVTTAKIGTLQVTTAIIADAQITSAKIVDATITSADIASATITNADIANATIGSAQITDATIASADIADAAITTAKIGDAQITTAKIATGAITNALLGTAVIDTAQIKDASITSAKIVSLDAGLITAGTLNAANITVTNFKAENIVTGTLTFASANQIENSAFQTGDWTQYTSHTAEWTVDTTTKYNNYNTGKVVVTGQTALVYKSFYTNWVAVGEGEDWIGSVYTYAADITTIDQGAKVMIEFYQPNKTTRVSAPSANAKPSANGVWERFSVKGTVPAGATLARLRVYPQQNGTMWAACSMLNKGNLMGEWQPSTNEILKDKGIQGFQIDDGTITNQNISAATITADKLVVGTITATQIASATITANNMVAGTITAASAIIADAAITSAKIADATVTSADITNATIVAADIASATITTAVIGDAQITSAKITDLTVATADIADVAITTAKITTLNVTTATIADANITTAKIASLAVTTADIGDLQVTTAKIATLNVTTATIADANITNGKIANLSVTTGKISDADITTAKIADLAVTTAKITDLAVTNAKIQDLDGNKITANSISAAKIMVADFKNLATVNESFPETMLPTSFTYGGTVVSSDGIYVKKAAAANSYLMLCNFQPNPFVQNDYVYYEFYLGSAAAGNLNVTIWAYDANKTNLGSVSSTIAATTAVKAFSGTFPQLTASYWNTAKYYLIGISGSAGIDISVRGFRGYIKNKGALIVDGSITASQLNISTLSAISADIGTITAGDISGVTMNLASGKFIVDGSGNVTFKGALSGATGDFAGKLSADKVIIDNGGIPWLAMHNATAAKKLGMMVLNDGSLDISRYPIADNTFSNGEAFNSILLNGKVNITSGLGASLDFNNFNADNVNRLTFNDIGGGEGIEWLSASGLNNWKIVVTDDAATGNTDSTAYPLQFFRNGTRYMTLGTGGMLYLPLDGVKIGSYDSGSGTLVDQGAIELRGATPYIDFEYGSGTTDYDMRLICNGADTLTVSGGNLAATVVAPSKESLKENIEVFDKSGMDIINSAKAKTYNYKERNNNEKKIGLIAEESPEEILTEGKDAVDIYSMVTISWKALQEIYLEIEKLKQQLGKK